MKFNSPTLVTITAPTCSGKTFFLEHLLRRGFNRIVSTTTRPPRQGEQQGVDYDFVTLERSLQLQEADAFTELVIFNGTRYGVTKTEMAVKMIGELAPVVVLEPKGLGVYERYCQQQRWEIFKIFVQTPEAVRLKRLAERTVAAVTQPRRTEEIEQIIQAHTNRALSIAGAEREWFARGNWDVVLPGDDVQVALQRLQDTVNAISQTTKF